MEIILTALDDELGDAFENFCGGIDGVTISRGSIFDVECDGMVSPANSFGFVDGGLDSWFCWHFGKQVQDNVRMAILKNWHGELPVGAAEIVETGDDKTKYLIAAPTMRVPMYLGEDTINPYLAMRAVIILLREGRFKEGSVKGEMIRDHLNRVAVPGLGTGVGKVPFDLAAYQISRAIKLHSQGMHFLPKSWFEATENHQALLNEKFEDLQHKAN